MWNKALSVFYVFGCSLVILLDIPSSSDIYDSEKYTMRKFIAIKEKVYFISIRLRSITIRRVVPYISDILSTSSSLKKKKGRKRKEKSIRRRQKRKEKERKEQRKKAKRKEKERKEQRKKAKRKEKERKEQGMERVCAKGKGKGRS